MDTRGSATSLIMILVILCHIAHAFARFLNTKGQSSFAADITFPRYLKEVIIYRRRPYEMKSLDVTALSSSYYKRSCFRLSPFLHYVVR